ncbi:MAG: ABC transporter substrate-binding protein [Eubacterium sp.]|jgi:peptide/nickel transport system substrate-binding protein
MKKKVSLLVAVIMVLTTLLYGCGSGTTNDTSTESDEGSVKDTITIVTETEPETLDPASANSDAIALVLDMIGDHLFDLNADGTITPGGIVESFEQQDDTTVKFTIKSGLKFSDGSDLTTEDIVWELGRLKEAPRSSSNFAFVDIDNTEIVDDTTFILKFNQAWSPYQNTLATGRGTIISKDAFESMGESEFGRSPVTSGPYKVEEWVPGTSITLVRNENYWGEPAKTAKIVIKFIPEETSRVIELETGAADIAYYIEGNDAERVEALDGYHVEQGNAYRNVIITFSMQDDILKNQKVRQALCYAIDQESLVQTSSDGLGTLNTGFVSIPTLGYKEMDPWPYDVEKAKSLLAEAGYPDGFTIDLHLESVSLYEKIATILQNMWGEIGVNVNIVTSALATYDAQNDGHFQACIRDITASEISNELIIYESSFGSRLQGNDTKLDEMLLNLRTYYYDDPERQNKIDEIYDYLYEQRYTYSIMNMPIIYAVSDKLEGFEFHPAIDHMKHITDWVVTA